MTRSQKTTAPAMIQTPPRIQRTPVCPPAPARPRRAATTPPPTTPIVIMQIEMRQHGEADEEVDDDDESEWMRSNIYFTSREAIARYFTNLVDGGGNGFENAIMLDIEENSSLEKFVQKITTMNDLWQINKNLNIYVYTNVINN